MSRAAEHGTERRAGGEAERRRSGRRSTDGGAATEAWLDPFGQPAMRTRPAAAGMPAFQRFYRLFLGARAVVGLALVVAQVTGSVLGVRSVSLAMGLSLGYAVQALVVWLLPRFRAAPAGIALSPPATAATIGVDVAVFSVLHLIDPASGFNYVALLVLPVLMAAVLTPRITSLGTAAVAALVLLAGAWRGGLREGDATLLMTQAGLAGIGLFLIALLAGELAGRLAREEASARGSLELARQQAQLNRLVIEQMADGVLVVDRRMRVRAANPAARRLLCDEGMARPAPFDLGALPQWAALAQAVAEAFGANGRGERLRDVVLPFEGGTERTLRLRAGFTGRRAGDGLGGSGPGMSEELCVLFLEDLRTLQARTRQEKLAAMGRVSAGIAHEIRNPLAAIAQANALMEEDAVAPDQRRLTRIVADNVDRLKRIVDDVLDVAPGGAPNARVIDLATEVAAVVAEWARSVQLGLGASSRLEVRFDTQPDAPPLLAAPAPLLVRFDPDHLRRVLVNLLDNAHRHAVERPGAITLALARLGEAQVQLSVASDGTPIAADVERHLFEPFFSTRSRGTGLGLYICRELCERYGASIEYRLRAADEPNRNEFSVTMPLVVADPSNGPPP
ncbi:ATP-binding protein [Aquincola sp. MAHUQ-54]|uniref:histidine kinase n=1 Tax=Aquincola agrisoli TaxID=3119538 RepID=A0AAW9QF22_9BURK